MRKSSGHGWWRWLHNNIKVLMPLGCTLQKVKVVNFMLCVFYHNKIIIIKSKALMSVKLDLMPVQPTYSVSLGKPLNLMIIKVHACKDYCDD